VHCAKIDRVKARQLREARDGLDRVRAWMDGFQYGRSGPGQGGRHLMVEDQLVTTARNLLDTLLQEAERMRWVEVKS
jgi:hypothetical protein